MHTAVIAVARSSDRATWPATVDPAVAARAGDQAADRVRGDGDRLVRGERLQPGRHGLRGHEHCAGEAGREQHDVHAACTTSAVRRAGGARAAGGVAPVS
jgi:hypothetical protein